MSPIMKNEALQKYFSGQYDQLALDRLWSEPTFPQLTALTIIQEKIAVLDIRRIPVIAFWSEFAWNNNCVGMV